MNITSKQAQRKLTRRETAFIKAYLFSGNGALAAREAGYCQKYANRAAWIILRRPVIIEEIEKRKTMLSGFRGMES